MISKHKHKCPQCGYVWEHPDFLAGEPGLHDCMLCGTLVLKRYEGWKPVFCEIAWIVCRGIQWMAVGYAIGAVLSKWN